MGHTHLSFVVEKLQPSNSFKMYKLFVFAAVLAAATAEGYYPAGYAGYGGLYPAGLAGAYGAYGYGLAAPAYAAAPIAAAPIAAATYAAPAVVAPAQARYAVPAPRVIEEAPIVEKIVEPVEQWGYKNKFNDRRAFRITSLISPSFPWT